MKRLFKLLILGVPLLMPLVSWSGELVTSLTAREIEKIFAIELRRTVLLQRLASENLGSQLNLPEDVQKLFSKLEEVNPELRQSIAETEQFVIKAYLLTRARRVQDPLITRDASHIPTRNHSNERTFESEFVTRILNETFGKNPDRRPACPLKRPS